MQWGLSAHFVEPVTEESQSWSLLEIFQVTLTLESLGNLRLEVTA